MFHSIELLFKSTTVFNVVKLLSPEGQAGLSHPRVADDDDLEGPPLPSDAADAVDAVDLRGGVDGRGTGRGSRMVGGHGGGTRKAVSTTSKNAWWLLSMAAALIAAAAPARYVCGRAGSAHVEGVDWCGMARVCVRERGGEGAKFFSSFFSVNKGDRYSWQEWITQVYEPRGTTWQKFTTSVSAQMEDGEEEKKTRAPSRAWRSKT